MLEDLLGRDVCLKVFGISSLVIQSLIQVLIVDGTFLHVPLDAP